MLCNMCPRRCNCDREKSSGFCNAGEKIVVAKIIENFMWEEPCISGKKGALAIFFSGCNLRCNFCQNYEISHSIKGKEYSIEEFKQLLNSFDLAKYSSIDLITPTQFSEQIYQCLKDFNCPIPIVWNSSAYENISSLQKLASVIDVFMPDFKFYSQETSLALAKCPDYFQVALQAIKEMTKLKPKNIFKDGVLTEGVLIRHLVLPSLCKESLAILDAIKANIENPFISLMCQFTPTKNSTIKTRLFPLEYKIVVNFALKLGLDQGYIQDFESASENFIPDF